MVAWSCVAVTLAVWVQRRGLASKLRDRSFFCGGTAKVGRQHVLDLDLRFQALHLRNGEGQQDCRQKPLVVFNKLE